MKERAPAVTLLSHDIGVGGRSLLRSSNKSGIDLMPPAVRQNLASQIIITDQTGSDQRKRRGAFGEIDQHVVRRAPGSLRLAADIAQLFRLGINVDDFDLINDPVSGR